MADGTCVTASAGPSPQGMGSGRTTIDGGSGAFGANAATRAVAQRRARIAVYVFVGIGAGLGWAWLAAMVASMLAGADMSALGPGMGIFNRLNGFASLPPEVRAGLAALCAPITTTWSLADWATVAAMWVAMVAAMMLPSALPVFLAYGDLGAERAARGERVVPSVVLGLGYLAVWLAFAVVATAVQGGLTQARVMTPAGVPATMILAATTLIAAGIYQFTPLKAGCLARCRAPLPFFLERWTDRVAGVFGQGVRQGIDCLGCCWALMGVMFAVGVMNVVWIALLGALAVVEKVTTSDVVSRVIGVVLIAWGVGLLAASPVGGMIWMRFFG